MVLLHDARRPARRLTARWPGAHRSGTVTWIGTPPRLPLRRHARADSGRCRAERDHRVCQRRQPDGSRPAYFFVNLHKPETRPKWEMLTLATQAEPGHCLQASYRAGARDMPAFRRNAGFTAYVEGWPLHPSRRRGHGPLQGDPYSRFGQLTYQMWRAVRLAIDTGMHAMFTGIVSARSPTSWENAAKTELDVTNETDRYIGWPARRSRTRSASSRSRHCARRAEEKLGSRFDLRKFNDVVLQMGAVPLEDARAAGGCVDRARRDPLGASALPAHHSSGCLPIRASLRTRVADRLAVAIAVRATGARLQQVDDDLCAAPRVRVRGPNLPGRCSAMCQVQRRRSASRSASPRVGATSQQRSNGFRRARAHRTVKRGGAIVVDCVRVGAGAQQ